MDAFGCHCITCLLEMSFTVTRVKGVASMRKGSAVARSHKMLEGRDIPLAANQSANLPHWNFHEFACFI